jgi:hypothetical protein
MATTSSLPPWAAETADTIDRGVDVDAALMADIEAAMKTRNPEGLKFAKGTFDPGKVAAWNASEEAISTSASTPVTDPALILPGQGADAPQGTAAPGSLGGAIPVAATADGTPQLEGTPGVLPPPDPATASNPATYDVVLESGDTFSLNNDQAKYLLQLHNWLDSQPAEVKQQWGQIESGEAVAIPLSDYEAYKAWRAGGAPASQPAPQPLPPAATLPERPYAYDPSLVDAPTADYIARLEAAARAGAATAPAPPSGPQAASQPATPNTPTAPALTQAELDFKVQAEATRRVETERAISAATAKVAAEYSLTPDQVAHLTATTPRLNIIPSIAQQKRTYSPTGVLISEAPLEDVFTEAFQTAMTMDPALRTVRDNIMLQRHLAATNEARTAAATKKANAGSLATAPSAAVPGREVDMSKMTPGQRQEYIRAAMTAEIAAAMNGE